MRTIVLVFLASMVFSGCGLRYVVNFKNEDGSNSNRYMELGKYKYINGTVKGWGSPKELKEILSTLKFMIDKEDTK